MSKEKSKAELYNHKTTAFQKLDQYLNTLIESDDKKAKGKADKLCYWLRDWTGFISFEEQFSPMRLRRYKRGEIIKVHLGFNIGSEEGGLHYAVVLDKHNDKSSAVVTIVPLSSVKPSTDLSNLKKGTLFLGNEIFTSLNSKISATDRHLKEELSILKEFANTMDDKTSLSEKENAFKRLKACEDELSFLNKMRAEVLKMRVGSLALVNQITTVSKIRIYDPKTDHDVLSGIKLSNEKLDLIDREIIKLYTNT